MKGFDNFYLIIYGKTMETEKPTIVKRARRTTRHVWERPSTIDCL